MGQNFLHDQNLARWIVDALDPDPGEHLVEIGPGLGALTDHAAPRARSVTLIEKDGRLAAFLRTRFPDADLHHADATEWDPRPLFARGPCAILGNLPYYVTSPVLFRFASEPSPASRMVFTMQRELAERLAAPHGSKAYGAPTALVGRRWRATLLRKLPPQVFLPEPKVDSAVVRLEPRPHDAIPDCPGPHFEHLVKLGFSQRRKQLRKLLALPDWPTLARAIGCREDARAEDLAVEQWAALAAASSPATHAQNPETERFAVVDAEDRVIGSASRGEVHARHLLHRAVHIFLFNREGELFLQKRSRWKDKCPSLWDSSAAGHVDDGEGYADAASRETTEELGVSAQLREIAALRAGPNTGWEFVRLYEGSHEGPFTLPPAEIECGGFFPVPVLHEWIAARPADFAPGFLECWRAWLAARP
jgi:16S rRNA (adenine1518-N6/adenine1519-N6)-dimethyltransferase